MVGQDPPYSNVFTYRVAGKVYVSVVGWVLTHRPKTTSAAAIFNPTPALPHGGREHIGGCLYLVAAVFFCRVVIAVAVVALGDDFGNGNQFFALCGADEAYALGVAAAGRDFGDAGAYQGAVVGDEHDVFVFQDLYGADGLAVRDNIKSFADLKGKTIAVSAPGTTPHFFLSWMLSKNGIRLKDIRTVALEPQPAAQAFVSGRNDAAVSYEPYLSTIRAKPEAGRILATTVDYPAVIDTFGCTPQWLKANPKAAQGITDAYFEALDMIRQEPEKAYGIMGEVVKQTGEQFAESAKALRWADKAENQKFFASEVQPFMKEAAAILLESGVIRQLPQTYDGLADPQFIR